MRTDVRRVQMLSEVTFDCVADDIGPVCHAPTDHDDLRVDHMDQCGNSHSDPVTELVDHAAGSLVPILGRPSDVDRVVTGTRPSGTAVERHAGQASQGHTRCVLLPAALTTARALAPTHVDHHMTDLASETVGSANETTSRDDSPADSGADSHDQRIVTCPGRSHPPLGAGCAIGIVVNRNRATKALDETLRDRKVLDTGQVGRRHDDPVERHQSRNPDPDRGPLIDPDLERLHQFDESIFDGLLAGRRWNSAFLDDRTCVVDHHGQTLGSTDVETEPKRGSVGHGRSLQDSARTLSSFTVFKMRTSARLFTNPGRGTIRSIERLYVRTTPPDASGANM